MGPSEHGAFLSVGSLWQRGHNPQSWSSTWRVPKLGAEAQGDPRAALWREHDSSPALGVFRHWGCMLILEHFQSSQKKRNISSHP